MEIKTSLEDKRKKKPKGFPSERIQFTIDTVDVKEISAKRKLRQAEIDALFKRENTIININLNYG